MHALRSHRLTSISRHCLSRLHFEQGIPLLDLDVKTVISLRSFSLCLAGFRVGGAVSASSSLRIFGREVGCSSSFCDGVRLKRPLALGSPPPGSFSA